MPNKFTKKDKTLLTPDQIQALKDAATGGNSGSKAVDSAPVDNSKIGLRDSTGKVLPNTITVAQLVSVISDAKNKYNGAAIENLKQLGVVNLPLNSTISPTGQITPAEINAIKSVYAKGYANSPVGTPLDIVNISNGIKNGTLGASDNQVSTISRTSLDQPNIEASKSTINDVFLALLGRTATEKEIAQYTQKYLDYAAKNPTTTTSGASQYGTISTPTASGGTSNRLFRGSQSETSKSNNLNEQDFLKNQVRQSGEYNAFTAAGSAFDMLTKMAQKDAGAM